MKNTQNTVRQTISEETDVSSTEVTGFLSFLKNIEPHFTDFHLVEGAFRSRTNDKASVVETVFPYFGKMSFNFGPIKKGANLLSALDKKSRIVVTVYDDRVTFADKFQEIQLPISNTDYLYNRFFQILIWKMIFLKR